MSNPALRMDHVHIIAREPLKSARWYVETLGARIAAETVARGAAQIFVDLGGITILIRGERPGEAPADGPPIEDRGDFSSHNRWGIDHFGFLFAGDLTAFCAELAAKGVDFPVPLKRGVGGKLLCYIAAPDNVSIELMEA